MLVAAFGPTTAWQGREIIWDADHFILVGHGAVPAAGVLDYDRRGQLIWAQPGLRSWVVEVDRWERRGAFSWNQGAQASGGGKFPIWGYIVIGLVLIGFILAAVTAGRVVDGFMDRFQEGFAPNDPEVRTGVLSIQVGIETYAVEHGGKFPQPGMLNPTDMGPYISTWPMNPYSYLPMADGGGAGNFRYDVSADGGAYRLIGYGSDGEQVIQVSGGDPTTV
jgi:hypothetical protein